MNTIYFFTTLGIIFLGMLAFETFTFYKKGLSSWALKKVYRLQAKHELRQKSSISGFWLNLGHKNKVLREYKEQRINVQIKAIKKRDTPVFVEGLPRTTAWSVGYRRGVAETVICTDVEVVE